MAKDNDHRATRRAGRGKPSFDEGIEQLEAILDEIESGDVPLEQCLKHYEQGVKLVKHCQAVLDQAQQRIADLAPPEPPPPPEAPSEGPLAAPPEGSSGTLGDRAGATGADDAQGELLSTDHDAPGDE